MYYNGLQCNLGLILRVRLVISWILTLRVELIQIALQAIHLEFSFFLTLLLNLYFSTVTLTLLHDKTDWDCFYHYNVSMWTFSSFLATKLAPRYVAHISVVQWCCYGNCRVSAVKGQTYSQCCTHGTWSLLKFTEVYWSLAWEEHFIASFL